MPNEKIRIGVIGVGHLGLAHLRNSLLIDDAVCAGFYDIDDRRSSEVESLTGVKAARTLDELLHTCDAVSVVTPTSTHLDVCLEALNGGIHTLVEKPICNSVKDAQNLIHAAHKNDALLQVGHIERFNSAFIALKDYVTEPMFIESHRLMSFEPRNVDIAVILDLMIHDIDLVLYLIGKIPSSLEASGVSVITDNIDIANARLTFENGCVANLTASRISRKSMRKFRLFQRNSYISADLSSREAEIYTIVNKGQVADGMPVSELKLGDNVRSIYRHSPDIRDDNPLLTELKSFIDSIRNETEPPVTGEDGLKALRIANEILGVINQ